MRASSKLEIEALARMEIIQRDYVEDLYEAKQAS
jgi:hypothetical protein